MEEYKCINYNDCKNMISYIGYGRKPLRCNSCQKSYSMKLRRNSYREKVKNKVKVTNCNYKNCDIKIPFITNKPKYCPKHARKSRVEWLKQYYTSKKVTYCSLCNTPIKYETKKPNTCLLCKCREKIENRLNVLNKKAKNGSNL